MTALGGVSSWGLALCSFCSFCMRFWQRRSVSSPAYHCLTGSRLGYPTISLRQDTAKAREGV